MDCPIIYNSEEKIWYNPSVKPDIDPDQFFGDIFLKRINEIHPDKVLEIDHDIGYKWTAKELKDASITCAKNFLKLGVKQGDIVVVYSGLNHLTTPVIFGIYLIGGILHAMDTQCPEDDIGYSFNLLDPTVVLCDGHVYDKVVEVSKEKNLSNIKAILSYHPREDKNTVEDILLKKVDTSSFSFKLKGEPKDVTMALVSSSGSTGRSKVSILSHALILYNLQTWWPINEDSVVYYGSLLRWISQISGMIQCVLFGSCRVVSNKSPSGNLAADLIEKYKITHLFGIPILILEALECAKNNNKNISTVHKILTGGDKIPPNICSEVNKVLPNCLVIKGYGMTEFAGVISSSLKIGNCDGNGTYIWMGVRAKILSVNSERMGPNEIGQFCVKAPYMFSGYWKGARSTKETFDEEGWCLTGDYAYFDDNKKLHIVARYQDIISYRGKLIFPYKVENIITKHPAVSLAILLGIPHETDGQTPTVFIKLKDNQEGKDEEVLRKDIYEYLKSNLSLEDVPVGGIYFTQSIPVTYTGKIYRAAMRNQAVEWISSKSKMHAAAY